MTNNDIVDQLEQWLVDEINRIDKLIDETQDTALLHRRVGSYTSTLSAHRKLRQLRRQQETDK